MSVDESRKKFITTCFDFRPVLEILRRELWYLIRTRVIRDSNLSDQNTYYCWFMLGFNVSLLFTGAQYRVLGRENFVQG